MEDYDLEEFLTSEVEENELYGKRGQWDKKAEFFLTCLGYAVGVGSVVRFPYLCYRNGGGAFLIPYLLMLFIFGIPLFFMETSLGQFAGTGCITIFNVCPLFRGAGYAMVIVNLIVTMYYNVILSYSLVYFVMSFRTVLPWVDCNNPWNTENCSTFSSGLPKNITNLNTPADEFFHHRVLQISQGIQHPGNVVWEVLVANLVTWIVVYLCIMNGVKSVGKVVYFTAIFPYVVLMILLVRGATLPGAVDGIIYYIKPQWKYLSRFKTWIDASVQIFFSMGPGWGGLINMASYNRFKNNTMNDSIIVPIINGLTSILAGFVVFSVIGYMAHETGLPISDVATDGPGLAFVTYPEAIAMMPLPQLWAVLFFIMLFVLGLDSVFVQIESIVSSVGDQCPQLRRYKRTLALFWCVLMFLGSISCCTNGGMYVLSLLDWYSAAVTVIFVCIVEAFVLCWIYGINNFIRDLEFMIGKRIHWIWAIVWKHVTPINLVIILVCSLSFNSRITYNHVAYPDWAIAVGWMTCLMSFLFIPGYMIYKFAKAKGSFKQRLKKITKPTKKWGPALPENRVPWRALVASSKKENKK